MEITLQLSNWLKEVREIAFQAGDILKKHWGKVKKVQHKGFVGDLVTEVDHESERLIKQKLKLLFPEHSLLAEESGLEEFQSDFLWVIDPLDGTVNYAHQHPMVAVSIGLLHHKNPILGIIYNPFFNELFSAALGLGAKLNNEQIRVSKISNLSDSLLATGFAYDRRENPDNNYKEFCHFTHLTQGVRRCGAASLDLAYLACGRVDAYWERGLKPWDIAAGAIIVEEAGGKITDYDLSPLNLESGRILASNNLLHTRISQELMVLKTVENYSPIKHNAKPF